MSWFCATIKILILSIDIIYCPRFWFLTSMLQFWKIKTKHVTIYTASPMWSYFRPVNSGEALNWHVRYTMHRPDFHVSSWIDIFVISCGLYVVSKNVLREGQEATYLRMPPWLDRVCIIVSVMLNGRWEIKVHIWASKTPKMYLLRRAKTLRWPSKNTRQGHVTKLH